MVNNSKNNEYYIGLDIGTNSVGWAVTDKSYNILKFRGKNMWGVRLFDEAKTAADRRVHRTTRRRLKRRKWRLNLLKELFKKYGPEGNSEFYQKLNESNKHIEDREIKSNGLFNTPNEKFSDKQYYKKYPTIYHLRAALYDEEKSKDITDIRLLYLAIHHIIKYRGHFLINGDFNAALAFNNVWNNFCDVLKELHILSDEEDFKKMALKVSQLISDNETASKRAENLAKRLEEAGDNKKVKSAKENIGKLLVGNTCNLKIIFNIDEKECKIAFAKVKDYEEERAKLIDILGDNINFVDAAKAIYDWMILAKMLGDNSNEKDGKKDLAPLSSAKVSSFEKHKNDLNKLKSILEEYPEEYAEVFKTKKEDKKNGKIYHGLYGQYLSGKNELYEYLKTELNKIEDETNSPTIDKIVSDIEKDNFLPVQKGHMNGVIPYQLHKHELEKILENASKRFEFLKEGDETKPSVKEKIISLLTFRIPYYIGPLNTNSPNSWATLKEGVQLKDITPWNFSDSVDVEKSAADFITRMTNKCSYLHDEEVLPKFSVLYSLFSVYNEINKIKVGGNYLDEDCKKALLEKLITQKQISRKSLQTLLKNKSYNCSVEDITGIEDKINSNLTVLGDFKRIIGEKIKKEIEQLLDCGYCTDTWQDIESMIRYITLYHDAPKMLKNVLMEKFSNRYSETEIMQIASLKYTGWGRLSHKLLCDLKFKQSDSCKIYSNVIKAMANTNYNFNELLGQSFTLNDAINNENKSLGKKDSSFSYDNLVKDLYVSPSVKRGIWQALKIVQEIVAIKGCNPQKIFVEVTRGDDSSKKGKSTKSRKELLNALYKDIQENKEFQKLYNDHSKKGLEQNLEDVEEQKIRNRRVYLYFLQLGKCMYTGDDIDLNDVIDKTGAYELEHIIPRSKLKDDSLENLVLVTKKANQEKENKPLTKEIQKQMVEFWTVLKKMGLLSDIKYERLTTVREKEFSESDLAGFINRQLVTTSQTAKATIELLKERYSDSKLVYVKASNVSDFRQRVLKTLKLRSINDYHHAQDAYLNIVVGNVYNAKFTDNPFNWIKKVENRAYNIKELFSHELIRGDERVWDESMIEKVASIYNQGGVQITFMPYIAQGQLFDATIYKKGKKGIVVPIKKNMDPQKYGGYKSCNTAHFTLIKYNKAKNKTGTRVKAIVAIPIQIRNNIVKEISECKDQDKLQMEKDILRKYLEDSLGYKNVSIHIPVLRKNSVIELDGARLMLRGISGKNLLVKFNGQLVLDTKFSRYIKNLEKCSEDWGKAYISSDYNNLSDELFGSLLTIMNTPEFACRPGSEKVLEKLVLKEDNFRNELEPIKKARVIYNIITYLSGKDICDLSELFDGKKYKEVGKSRINYSKIDGGCVLHQSVTGLFEKKIKI